MNYHMDSVDDIKVNLQTMNSIHKHFEKSNNLGEYKTMPAKSVSQIMQIHKLKAQQSRHITDKKKNELDIDIPIGSSSGIFGK